MDKYIKMFLSNIKIGLLEIVGFLVKILFMGFDDCLDVGGVLMLEVVNKVTLTSAI